MVDIFDYLKIGAISGVIMIIACMAFYELMYFTWKNIDGARVSHRHKIFFILVCIFVAHAVAVLAYGLLSYFLFASGHGYLFHTSTGKHVVDMNEYIYFSVVTYSSLGMDDVLPEGWVKFLSGAEVLNGMVLIAWSASFTYISMEKFWNIRKGK